jgi:KDO2-lipid IV(A) lauroyltransferase
MKPAGHALAKTDDPDDSGNLGDRATDAILRGLIGAVMALPYPRRVPAMGWLVAKVIAPLAGYRKRAEANLALIYPDMPATDRRNIARAVCDNFGRTLIENYSRAEFATQLAGVDPAGPGLAAIEKARADGRPVIFVTGHFGNYEAPRQVLTARGYRIGGLYRPMRNTFFNDHYARTMTDMSGPVFEQGRRGTMGFARMIRDGGMGTLLFDVRLVKVPQINFLGRPALTSTSAADLALKFDALLVPYFGIRQPDGLSFAVEIEEPIAHSDALSMTVEMTRRLEARIAVNCEQWFWVHRRWRSQTGE